MVKGPSLVKPVKVRYESDMMATNVYFRRARDSGRKFRLLIRLTGLNRNSVYFYLRHFRERYAALCDAESPLGGLVSGLIQFNRVRLTALMVALAAFGSGAAFSVVSAPPLPVIAATDSSDDGHAASNAA